MRDHLETTLFEHKVENIQEFNFFQKELMFDGYLPNNRARYASQEVEYVVQFEKSNVFDLSKVPLIIPIKDMPDLLEYTLNNLKTNQANEYANIIVVDDRSGKNIKSIVKKYDFVSYIRVDNEKGFNYSMLANIAAFISRHFEFEEIIYWNSDMWLPNASVLPNLIKGHRNNKDCVISGTKLLYPDFNWDGVEREAVKNVRLPAGVTTHKNKVQFGGSTLLFLGQQVLAKHIKRFSDPDDPYVNVDSMSNFVTGAYAMMDLKWLIDIGGFNPSLSKVCNDVDICFRALKDNKIVMYFGKDKYLYHYESLNLNKENKFDEQYNSDTILFNKLWNYSTFAEMLNL